MRGLTCPYPDPSLPSKSRGEVAVECIVCDVDDLHAELMEIDENLARSELTPAEESAYILRRKAIYEEIHGPAKARGAHAANAVMGNKSDANAKSAFASATASASGKSLRAIQVAAQRGAIIGPDITRIVGTSLDKGVEMDALTNFRYRGAPI